MDNTEQRLGFTHTGIISFIDNDNELKCQPSAD